MSSVLAYLTLIVTVPLLAFTSWHLWHLVRKYHNPVTRTHAITVTVVLVLVLVFGLTFLNNDMPSPIMDTEATKLITRSTVCFGGLVVALARLRLLLRGKR